MPFLVVAWSLMVAVAVCKGIHDYLRLRGSGCSVFGHRPTADRRYATLVDCAVCGRKLYHPAHGDSSRHAARKRP